MRRRGFLAALLAAPAALVGLAAPAKRHLCGWLGLTRASYPVLKANIYGTPRALTEDLMRQVAEEVFSAPRREHVHVVPPGFNDPRRNPTWPYTHCCNCFSTIPLKPLPGGLA